jgi:hypothetical protein
MAKAPAAVAEAAERAGLGHLQRRYPGPIGISVYFGLMTAVFALCPGIGGAPWYIVMVPGAASVALLTVAVVTRLNKAVFLYENGLVAVTLHRRLKVVARWTDIAAIEWIDRRVFFVFTLTNLRWTEYTLKLAAGGYPAFTTARRDDATELAYIVSDKIAGR